jgi:uncharacterized membrane protein YphA (DoxX/SURF4 family)
MSIIHVVPRVLLAGYFGYTGWKALRSPDEFDADVQPTVDKLIPLAKRILPEPLGQQVPGDAPALVKCLAITRLAGSAMLATGIGRRIGAGLLAATVVPQIVTAAQADEGREELLATDAALLGGTLLAAADTQGKPSLWWRAKLQHEMAQDNRSRHRKELRRAKKAASKAAKAE